MDEVSRKASLRGPELWNDHRRALSTPVRPLALAFTERYGSVKWENKPKKERTQNPRNKTEKRKEETSQDNSAGNSLENSYAVSQKSTIPNGRRQKAPEEGDREKKDRTGRRVGRSGN